MNTEKFWHIVDTARLEAGLDVEGRVDSLRGGLSDATADELQSFQNIYDEQIRRSYRWDLAGAACVINRGSSDDGFRYFRDWLISEGRNTFEQALTDPDSLADLPKAEFAELESFGYVALELYEEQDWGELKRDFSTETAPPAGEEWVVEDLPELFPRLTAIYGVYKGLLP